MDAMKPLKHICYDRTISPLSDGITALAPLSLQPSATLGSDFEDVHYCYKGK